MSEEVSRRLDAIGMKGQSLTLKIMERDPSAPIEASKVCVTTDSVCPRWFTYLGFGNSLWDMDVA